MNPARVALFYLLLLLASPLAAAVPSEGFPPAQEADSSSLAPPVQPRYIDDLYTPAQPEADDLVLTFQSLPGGGSVCRFSTLSDLDVQRFKDSILVPGLVGDEVSAGTLPNTDRETISDSNVLIVPNPSDEETAFKKQIPNQVLQPDELAPLQNQRIKGPFAFGLSLYDSLRAAKCVQGGPCAVQGESLQLRNSGEGISGNVQDMWQSITGGTGSLDASFSEEEAAFLQAQVAEQQAVDGVDSNAVPALVYSRKKDPNVLNHIAIDNTFQAGLLTNCEGGDCVITLYSMFDKYFNSWFSGEMVVGTFGPTLWGQFKKLLTNSKRFNLVSGKFTDKVNAFLGNAPPSFSTPDALFKSGKPIGPNDFFEKYSSLDSVTGSKGFYKIDGDSYFRNLKTTAQKDQDLGKLYDELFIQGKVQSNGQFSGLQTDLFNPDTGALAKITDFDKRQKIFNYTKKLSEHAQITGAMRSQLDNLLSKELPGGVKKTAVQIAEDRVKAARGYGKIFLNTDDAFNMDLKAVWKKLPDVDFRTIYVKDPNTGVIRSLSEFDDKYFDEAFDSFVNTGSFNGLTRLETDGAGNIVRYQFTTSGSVLGYADKKSIEDGLFPASSRVLLSTNEAVAATVDNLPVILKDIEKSGGKIPPVYGGGFKVADKPFTSSEYAERILSGGIMPGKVKNYAQNTQQLYETMIARDWGKAGYSNVLSKSLQSQEKLLSNYFKVWNPNVLESGVGWTAKTYTYWWMTQGFGLDQFSVYQLPDKWTEVKFEPGNTDFYDDAYIDFFANEGSDTGDIFKSVISNLPVPLIIDEFVGESPTLQKGWDFINGGQGRTTPDNLAMFLFGPQACPDCVAAITSPTKERFDVQFSSTENTNSFFLEHAKSKEAKEEGQLLITFAHRTNIEGKMLGEELQTIDLVKAREDEETCQQVMDDLFIYGAASRLIGAEKVGAVLAITENVTYLAGGMMGAFVTVANQLAFAPKMNECVDDKEGYFASLYVPHDKEENKAGKADELQKSVSQDALDGIREFANQIDQNRTGQSLTDNVLKEATSKVRELVDEAQEDDVAEAELRITGSSSGYIRSEEVMYFWVGGGSLVEPTKYLTEGKTLLTTEDGHTITVDNETGTIVVDGQEVIGEDKDDHTRLTNKNLAIPAMEVPQRINGFQLGDSNALLLTMNVRGETLVQDPALLDCLQSAVMEQTGVPLNSNNMGEAFGRGQSVTTDAFPSISVDTINNRIQLGGQVPQTAFGAGASIQLYGNRRVVVTGAAFPEAGNFQSASWENGTVVYKPATNELLIWLRHHQQAIVSDEEVKGFNGDLTTTINPNTQCEEPAIDLSVETDPNSPAAKLKGDNLTAGLKKNGPFQVFETPTKQFILYSKLVDGACKDFFKVINKETGEVYDQEITDITQGDDGTINIKTADGQSHSLQFSDQNGKPVLTYDGNSELLNSASGKGGSFYYDPNKGLYYAENAQLIPLNDNFRNQGIGFQANPDGSVSGKAAENVFNINTGQGADGLFNIPSIPEDLAGAGLVLLIIIGCVVGLYVDTRRKKELPFH